MNATRTGFRRLASTLFSCCAAASLLAPLASDAACPDAAAVKTYIADFEARRPNDSFTKGLSLDDAKCARAKLIAALPSSLGPAIGYRAAFTNDMARGMLKLDEPVWGIMYGKHIVRSPAKVPLQYGAVTFWDPDLLVEVKDPRLAEAKTPLEALQYLSAVIPFLGLKDNMSDTENLEHFVAINAGFRGGVLGKKIAVTPTRRFLNSLNRMTVEIKENGTVMVRAKEVLFLDGGPINSAMWLAKNLKDNGIELKKGDLLALGGFTMGQFPRKDLAVTVQYAGLPGNPVLELAFD